MQKNANENEKKYNRANMPLCISKMGRMPKPLMKTKKCVTGPHASLYFENGPNAKTAHENEKNV